MGDIDAAEYHFRRAVRLRPDLGENHNNLGTLLCTRAQKLAQLGDQAGSKREMGAAIERFTEACRLAPHVWPIKRSLADALAAASRCDEAADVYEELVTQQPNNAALLNNYGVTLYKQGKKGQAITQFRKALEIDPNLKDAKESLAIALGEKPDPAADTPKPPAARER
jgi:Tfp pilus assembly protein PilF